VPRGAANFRIFADLFRNVPTESFVTDTHDGGKAMNYGLRSPRGVIAVVCPWNLPLLLMTWKVGPALACGNTVIVKPSRNPLTATLLAEVMRDAGVLKGVYNVVHGFGPESAGAFLTEHPGVNGVTFTGETGTGEAIMRAAAKGVRPVSFELGGKNPGSSLPTPTSTRRLPGSRDLRSRTPGRSASAPSGSMSSGRFSTLSSPGSRPVPKPSCWGRRKRRASRSVR
jgi:acyl-CoA reductase-like NAD-dependent aldehyde dehydrogenase